MIRTFVVYRDSVPDNHAMANPPGEPQFEGAVFSDGTVIVRWLTEVKSFSLWGSMEQLLKVHGHPEYGTRLVWSDE